ncbi:hypothetical protein GGG16DRAFT_38116, partial [Schizophyllum commune]
DIEDEEAIESARTISPKVYVGCTLESVGAPQLPPAYGTAYIALVQQGLPPDKPEEFFESRMCVPIRPNTEHPEDRRSAHCCHPLPWDGCYHSELHYMRVRIKTDDRPIDPPHSLGPGECVAVTSMLEEDAQRRECLRDCAEKGLTPPPAALGEMALCAIEVADEELSDVPYWRIRAAEKAERSGSPPSEDYCRERNKAFDAAHNHSDCACDSSGSDRESGSDSIHSRNTAQEDGPVTHAVPPVDNIADVERDILAIINYKSDLRDVSPVIVPLSYDLSTLDAPPSPTGFMEELQAIKRIRSEFEERVRKLKEEVRRRDDVYMAGIEARRTARSSEEAQAASSIPARSKWLFLTNLSLFNNRMKARFATLEREPRVEGVASLQDIEDEEVAEAARKISPKVYVGCPLEIIGAPQLPPAYLVADVALVQQGLPPERPEEFLESRMCVPIRPNTQHPEGRRPAHCCTPLPWDGCYHVALHHMLMRIKSEDRPIDPPHSLSPPECVALISMLEDDQRRRQALRECAARGLTLPPPSLGEQALSAIKLANRKVTDIPSWQVKEAEEAERLAYSPPDDDHYVEDDENSESTSAYSAGSRVCSSGGNDDASNFNSTRSGDDAREDAAMDTGSVVDDTADFEHDILAAMNPQSDTHYASPVIVPLSYDLGSLDAPPSPTGFMEELEELNRIRLEYEQRVLRLKEEIRRRDDEYVAGIEARRIAKGPEEPQITSSPSTQSKWPFAPNIVPFTNKLKARLG